MARTGYRRQDHRTRDLAPTPLPAQPVATSPMTSPALPTPRGRTPRADRLAKRAARQTARRRRMMQRRRLPTGGNVAELTTAQIHTLHQQCYAILVAETEAATSADRLDAIVFGSQNGSAYVDYIETILAALEWSESYAARHAPYEEHHSAFTSGGR